MKYLLHFNAQLIYFILFYFFLLLLLLFCHILINSSCNGIVNPWMYFVGCWLLLVHNAHVGNQIRFSYKLVSVFCPTQVWKCTNCKQPDYCLINIIYAYKNMYVHFHSKREKRQKYIQISNEEIVVTMYTIVQCSFTIAVLFWYFHHFRFRHTHTKVLVSLRKFFLV